MIGTAIKLVRNSRGISSSEVARKAGIARSHLRRLENGLAVTRVSIPVAS